jgi:hypothetical protein
MIFFQVLLLRCVVYADEQLPLLYSGCLLLGFFSHKVALVVKLVDDLSPKVSCRVAIAGWQ